MITLRPFDDLAAHAVLSRLDMADQTEAELMRGATCTGLALFADWRAVQAAHIVSQVAHAHGQPFAVFALANTGQAGVAQAALLARDHHRWRGPLARLAVLIRLNMPGYAARNGIHRIEARSWVGHPTADRLLSSIGFQQECAMPGFGATGQAWFRQYAWLCPSIYPPPPPAPNDPAPTTDPSKGEDPCA